MLVKIARICPELWNEGDKNLVSNAILLGMKV